MFVELRQICAVAEHRASVRNRNEGFWAALIPRHGSREDDLRDTDAS